MYLFFDTETTGLPKNWKAPVTNLSNWPRLVQLAWILCDTKGNIIDKNDCIIKPVGFKIPKEAAQVHGITTELALAEGLDIIDVILNFLVQIKKATTLVAHNISFDEKIIGAELLRHNYPNILEEKKKICTMKSTTDFVKISGYYGYKWPTLSELYYKLFGEHFENAHDASADIYATYKCFWKAKSLKIF